MIRKIHAQNIREDIREFERGAKCGALEEAYLFGKIYTARDAAHKKLIDLIDSNMALPFEIKDSVIYYAGPTPVPKVNPFSVAVGSCGPTTSKRMDIYTEPLLKLGLACMIGKGERSEDINKAIKIYNAAYLLAIGGAGAIYSKCIKSARVIAFEELGCESIKEFEVENFPVYIHRQAQGRNLEQ